jgi:hypothetical protein
VDSPIDIADLVRHGVAVIVATRDAQLRPEVGRAWGPSLSEDGERLTVCVEAAPESSMARNLASNSPAAATLARLASHTMVQLKGRVVEFGTPTQDRLDAVDEHVEAFVAETAAVGVPESLARGFVASDLLTLTIEVSERFDETPGPRAGTAL